MTDAEWVSWQSSWTGAMGPLPEVRAKAKKQILLHRFANVTFFALIFVTLAIALPEMAAAREPEVKWVGVLVIGFFAIMAAGYLLIQRRVASNKSGSPRDALAFLERRLRVEQLTAHLVRWGYAALCLGFLLIFPKLIAHHEQPWLEKAITYPWMALVLAVTFTAPWWVARRNRKYQEEIQRWRRWMDEHQL